MHRSIIAIAPAAALAAGPACALAQAACPGPGMPLVERFIDADCTACWSAPAETAGPGWVLDWIVPNPAGDEAPMSAVALPVGVGRVRRSGAPVPTSSQSVVRHTALPAGASPRIAVQIGPAWHGYLALTLEVSGRLVRNEFAPDQVGLVHIQAGGLHEYA